MHQNTNNQGHYDIKSPNLHRKVRWLSGKKHPVEIKEPIKFILNDRFGTVMPEFLQSASGVLMSKRLIDSLHNAGVDNFGLYEAILIDEKRNIQINSHCAVQVIGKISATDESKSDAFDPMNIGHTLVQYRKLVIKNNDHELLMFRLNESVTTLIIHENVKRKLDVLNLEGVLFDLIS